MEHHAITALMRRSGPKATRRALLFLNCFRQVRLKPVVPPKDKIIATDAPKVGADAETGGDPSGTEFGTRLSLDCILFITHAMISFDHSPPRFVFAVCPSSVVLRSADRGRTWRKITLARVAKDAPKVPTPPPIEKAAAAAVSHQNDDAKQLADILGLLPSSDNGGADDAEYDSGDSNDDDATSTVPTPPLQPFPVGRVSTQPDLLAISCFQDTVVVCGEDGMLAVSVDRGVTFSYADPQQHLSLIQNRTKSKHALHAIRGVVFLNSNTLAFYTSSQVCRLKFTTQGLNTVVFEGSAVSILKLPRGPIGGMWTMDWAITSSSFRPLWISTISMLRLSCDGGTSWLPVPHSIGLVRAAVFPDPCGPRPAVHPSWSSALEAVGILPVTQSSAMEAHASPSSLASSSQVDGAKPGTAQGQQSNKVFSFALESKFTTTAGQASTSHRELACCSTPVALLAPSSPHSTTKRGGSIAPSSRGAEPEDGAIAMVCYALSTNGKIVPYDFTSVLHILCTIGKDSTSPLEVRVHSIASCVEYLPFVQSATNDRVGLDMAARRVDDDEGGRGHVLVRSTAAGVSTSSNYGERSREPARSFLSTSCRLDEGCFVFGCQKKSVVITEDYGATFKAYALPINLRVAVITDIAVMR
ncbi:Hypothetical protein, putative [Bodo saltans]|uniref:Uncharacterized protein n=1 Tax=Bodo saltans TaxID=75058 RepID=A0A0S4IYH7_BODSA|nr:Hypothetical protein, putative [Bodo saltans]|eukprot:CUG55080.1 Hypothetical protein, putative [Bodo saltans]